MNYEVTLNATRGQIETFEEILIMADLITEIYGNTQDGAIALFLCVKGVTRNGIFLQQTSHNAPHYLSVVFTRTAMAYLGKESICDNDSLQWHKPIKLSQFNYDYIAFSLAVLESYFKRETTYVR